MSLVINSGGMGQTEDTAATAIFLPALQDTFGSFDLTSVPAWLWLTGAALAWLMWMSFNSDSERSIRRAHRGGLLA